MPEYILPLWVYYTSGLILNTIEGGSCVAVAFFYGSTAAIWMLFFICVKKRPLTFKHFVIAVTGMGYSLLYETFLGEYNGLYHYITPGKSLFYIIMSAIFIYPVIEVIYTMFLPDKLYPILIYTIAWILAMLLFELASLYTKTIVLTGWKVIPWSIVTYAFTYSWIILLFNYMKKRGL